MALLVAVLLIYLKLVWHASSYNWQYPFTHLGLSFRMMDLTFAQWLSPWEFSPSLLATFTIAAILFIRGSIVTHVNITRQSLFWVGYVMLYLAMHTHVDYFAERVFYIHRVQHVFLHHLAPLLVMASYPGQVLRAGMPLSWRIYLKKFRQTRLGIDLESVLTHKIFIPLLFVFLVLVWLIPSVQFYSMLDVHLYRLMNWSVVISGFLYWNLILDRRPSIAPVAWQSKTWLGRLWERSNARGYPAVMPAHERIFSPILTMLPQMIAGGFIAFTSNDLYPLFDLCGRAVDITALQDQTLGGVIMWVPAAVVEAFGMLAALMTWLRLSAQDRKTGLSLSQERPPQGRRQSSDERLARTFV